MTQAKEFYDWLEGDKGQVNCPDFQKIKEKFEINSIDDKVSIRKALEFLREVFDIDFYFYDKFLRYARKFDCLIEEDKDQRNWKLFVTYRTIKKLMFMPLYEYFKIKEKL